MPHCRSVRPVKCDYAVSRMKAAVVISSGNKSQVVSHWSSKDRRYLMGDPRRVAHVRRPTMGGSRWLSHVKRLTFAVNPRGSQLCRLIICCGGVYLIVELTFEGSITKDRMPISLTDWHFDHGAVAFESRLE